MTINAEVRGQGVETVAFSMTFRIERRMNVKTSKKPTHSRFIQPTTLSMTRAVALSSPLGAGKLSNHSGRKDGRSHHSAHKARSASRIQPSVAEGDEGPGFGMKFPSRQCAQHIRNADHADDGAFAVAYRQIAVFLCGN